MKKIIFTVLAVLVFPCLFQEAFGQSGSAGTANGNPIISVEDIQKSLSATTGPSLAETVKESVEERLRAQMATAAITEETVRSAIDGTFITEEVVPEVDNTAVNTADTKTKRYLPRVALDFGTFPLRPLSGKIGLTEKNEDDVIVLQQTNSSLTEDIARRIQTRLSSPGIRFEFKNRTVILAGAVTTVRKKELAETMLSLEPGIDKVENRLTIL